MSDSRVEICYSCYIFNVSNDYFTYYKWVDSGKQLFVNRFIGIDLHIRPSRHSPVLCEMSILNKRVCTILLLVLFIGPPWRELGCQRSCSSTIVHLEQGLCVAWSVQSSSPSSNRERVKSVVYRNLYIAEKYPAFIWITSKQYRVVRNRMGMSNISRSSTPIACNASPHCWTPSSSDIWSLSLYILSDDSLLLIYHIPSMHDYLYNKTLLKTFEISKTNTPISHILISSFHCLGLSGVVPKR